MSDDKSNRGEADRARVSAEEDHEVRVIAEKFGLSMDDARVAIRSHGPMRADIEEALRKR